MFDHMIELNSPTPITDHIAAVQPMIAELERDSSIANLSELIRTGLDNVSSDPEAQKLWSQILDRLSSGASTAPSSGHGWW